MNIRKAARVLCALVLVIVMFAGCLSVFAAYPRLAKYRDIPQGAWYCPYVDAVVKSGIMNGMSDTSFGVDQSVSLAQTITMAARLHSLYYTGEENFGLGTDAWYSPYVKYAVHHGIIDSTPSAYESLQPVSKGVFAQILSAAYPDEALQSINSVNYIPDMDESSPYYDAVIRLYRAGVCTGGEDNSYNPRGRIKRVEAAAIVTRMTDPSQRQNITLREQTAVWFDQDAYVVNVGSKISLSASSQSGAAITYEGSGDAARMENTSSGVSITGQKVGLYKLSAKDSSGNSAQCLVYVHTSRQGTDLADLVSAGKVSVEINVRSIQRGTVALKNLTDEPITFFMSPGSYLSPSDKSYQRMLITKLGQGTLPAGGSQAVSVALTCMDFELTLPDRNCSYTYTKGSSGVLALLADHFSVSTSSFAVQQAAVWIAADNVTYAECGTLVSTSYGQSVRTIKEADYEAAGKLVEKMK